MSAGSYSFTIEQGTDFSRVLTWKDSNGNLIDLTGYTAACQVRDFKGGVLIDFTEDGSITLGGTEGTVTLELPNSFTSTLDFDTARYDLKLTSSGSLKDRLVQGTVTLSKEVTE